MMIEKEKMVQVLLYIVDEVGSVDFHKIFKILYFAEQKHIVRYGSPIIGDSFIKMDFGPVPSHVRDFFNYDKEGNLKNFEINEYIVSALVAPDLEEIAESEIECLKESIIENKNLNFNELKLKSHQAAWNSVPMAYPIRYSDIALEGGANKEMLKYLENYFENKAILEEWH